MHNFDCKREGLSTNEHHQIIGDSSRLVNGWIRGPNSELLFWVPSQNRKGLFRARNVAVLSVKAPTVLDLRKIVYGRAWEKCQVSNELRSKDVYHPLRGGTFLELDGTRES
jgi:hypothetical protein